MKRIIAIIFIAVFALLSFAACDRTPETDANNGAFPFPSIPDTMTAGIKNYYLSYLKGIEPNLPALTADDITMYYLGSYNGYSACAFSVVAADEASTSANETLITTSKTSTAADETSVVTNETTASTSDYTVGGITISFPYPGYTLILSKNYDTFTQLQDAYDSGELTAQDIRDIKYYAEHIQDQPASFPPFAPLAPLSDSRASVIKSDYIGYLKGNRPDLYSDDLTADSVEFSYLGTYNGYDIITIGIQYIMIDDGSLIRRYYYYYIAGYSIGMLIDSSFDSSFDSRFELLCYKNNMFKDVKSIYETGELTRNDISAIVYYNNSAGIFYNRVPVTEDSNRLTGVPTLNK